MLSSCISSSLAPSARPSQATFLRAPSRHSMTFDVSKNIIRTSKTMDYDLQTASLRCGQSINLPHIAYCSRKKYGTIVKRLAIIIYFTCHLHFNWPRPCCLVFVAYLK
jgi:hypothetical protein